jgi:acyl-CoA thioesterase II
LNGAGDFHRVDLSTGSTLAAVGDLSVDTAVEGSDGRYTATLNPDWQIWGPMGGYLASIALRAAAADVAPELTPASFSCQFISTASFEPVDIEVVARRSSRRAALVAAGVAQHGKPVLDAQAWFAAGSSVVEHDHTELHRYGHPDAHRPISAYTSEPLHRAWQNFERRPLDWIDDWESFDGGPAEWAEWLQFLPATFDDPVLEACRVLVLADLPSFPAAIRAHPRTRDTWVAPSLDLAVQFHRLAGLGEWLLVRGLVPIIHRGLVGFRSEVWTASGELAASGSGQCLCRPITTAT